MNANDSSLELHDVAGLALVLAFVGLSVFSTLHDPAAHFDPQAFGTGGAALIAGIGGAGWLKGRLRQGPPLSRRSLMPNPWIILGFVVALILAGLGGFFYGEHVDALAWGVAIEKQKAEAANDLAAATARTRRRPAPARRHQHRSGERSWPIIRRPWMPRLLKTSALLLALSACSTPQAEVGRVVQAPCPVLPDPPPAIRDYAPPTESYQGVVAGVLTRCGDLARSADREAGAAAECHDWVVRVSGVEGRPYASPAR